MAESLAEDVASFLADPKHRDIRVDMEERVSPEIVRGIREGMRVDRPVLGRRGPRRPAAAQLPQRTTWPSSRTRRTRLARRDEVRFEDVLDHEFVGMPALSAVQLMLAREAARGAASRWCTACW